MRADWNKSIENISYNHLNLPVTIRFRVEGETKIIEYLYNAVGVKVAKRVVHQGQTANVDDTTLYMGGFQYLNDVLQFFPTSEGYVSVTGSVYNYVFNYTDHLGNVRLTYTKDPVTGVVKALEHNHYYPYGMKHSNYNDARHDYRQGEGGVYALIEAVDRSNSQYKYNGKEWQDELGLNLYDMDFRDYDPAIGRWTGIDPVIHYSQSTYNGFDGNPVFWADPSGTSVIETKDAFTFTGADAGNFFEALKTAMGGEDGIFTLDDEEDYDDLSRGLDGEGGGGGEPNKKTSGLKKRLQANGEILTGNIKSTERNILKYIDNLKIENNTIIWISHGSYNGINGQMLAAEFHEFLLTNSPLYKSRFENNESIILKIFSCNTGHPDEGGFASNLSRINKNATIWAPDNLISFPASKWYTPGYQSHILYGGHFNIFNNGVVTGTGNFKN